MRACASLRKTMNSRYAWQKVEHDLQIGKKSTSIEPALPPPVAAMIARSASCTSSSSIEISRRPYVISSIVPAVYLVRYTTQVSTNYKPGMPGVVREHTCKGGPRTLQGCRRGYGAVYGLLGLESDDTAAMRTCCRCRRVSTCDVSGNGHRKA